MVCIRCQKRPAIIFIQRMENGQMKQEGYCLHCARELHIKPVDDLMKQFGMSEQDLDNMENRMESMMEELGDSNPLSMLMNMSGSGEDADAENMDEDLVPGRRITPALSVKPVWARPPLPKALPSALPRDRCPSVCGIRKSSCWTSPALWRAPSSAVSSSSGSRVC